MNTEQFYQKLDQYYQSKQFQEAEQFMLLSLKEAGEQRDLEGIVATCNELGGLYRATHRTEEALWAYDKVQDCLPQLGMEHSINCAAALINLGSVYTVRKEFRTAYEIYKKAEAILNQTDENEYQLAALYNNMSACLRETGQERESISLVEKAIRKIERIPGHEIDLATSYVNMGQALIRADRLKEARKSLENALTVFQEAHAEGDSHYAIGIYALAGLNERERDYHAAREGYAKAAALTEKSFGKSKDYEQILSDLERVERYLS